MDPLQHPGLSTNFVSQVALALREQVMSAGQVPVGTSGRYPLLNSGRTKASPRRRKFPVIGDEDNKQTTALPYSKHNPERFRPSMFPGLPAEQCARQQDTPPASTRSPSKTQ